MNAPGGEPRKIGRYRVLGEIASGGMATVYLGRLLGPVGFARVVAIKSLHAQYAKDPDFLSMFLDEARLASRVRHPNVVPIVDVLSQGRELHLVMEYVEGESLSRLSRPLRKRAERVPLPIAIAIMIGVLDGLHAAHEAKDDDDQALGIVHRDVSPQNILVGVDGAARIVDFGIAKAVGRMQTTRGDQLKGKIAYMAPEQLSRDPLDRRADVYAASIVLWELVTGQRLFHADDEISTFKLATEAKVVPPSSLVPEVTPELDAIVLAGLSRDRDQRYGSAREMAMMLEKTELAASSREVGDWVRSLTGDSLSERGALLGGTAASDASDSESDSDISLPTALAARLSGGEADTAILSAAVASTKPSERARSRAALALVLAFGGVVALATWLLSKPAERAADPPPPSAKIAEPASVPSPPSSISAAVATTPSAPSAPNVTTAPAATPPAKSKAASSKPRPRKADCQNPFTVDAKGVRVPKLECL